MFAFFATFKYRSVINRARNLFLLYYVPLDKARDAPLVRFLVNPGVGPNIASHVSPATMLSAFLTLAHLEVTLCR